MLRKNFHSCSNLSKKILERVSPRTPENRTWGLVGLEDSTVPCDTGFGHLKRTPSIVIQEGFIVAQVGPMLRSQSCASSEMSKKPLFRSMLRKNFHSCSNLSKRTSRRISSRPPENKPRGLMGFEDLAAPYDAGFGHLHRTPSIMMQAGSIVAQVRRMSRGQSCASSEMSKKPLFPPMLRKNFQSCATFSKQDFRSRLLEVRRRVAQPSRT
jgi:hypothetical protein